MNVKFKKTYFIILVGFLSLYSNLLFSFYHGIPVPYIHDEFSYLLAADTFAHGHVTNPPHQMWEHFETFYVLQHPTYTSKYPPAQAAFLAIGQVLGGHPICGVWLSEACMCMAICWMLYAWVPLYWALVGGIISVIQFGVFTYWSQSYWGGAVAALGGALIFGALPRIFRYQQLKDVFWLGSGIFIVVNSRPLEGILLGIPIGCLALPWKIKWDKIKNPHFLKRIALPFALMLLLIILTVGAYNKAVTGKPYTFPALLSLHNEMARPLFIFEPLKPMPALKHMEMLQFIKRYSNKHFFLKRTWKGFWTIEASDIHRMFDFYFGYILAFPVVLFLIKFLHKKKMLLKLFLITCILCLACMVMPSRAHAHYFSPVMVLAVFLVILGLRTLVILSRPIGMTLFYVLLALQIVCNILSYSKPVEIHSYGYLISGQGLPLEVYTHATLQKVLIKKGGKHLVLVDYVPNRLFYYEWVQNTSDIDKQPIVWARSMNDQEDAKLLNYYKDRRVWRIRVFRETIKHPILI